jgi:glycosyltransferase involved in cell wall biosynthesis
MYGTGALFDDVKSLINKNKLQNIIKMKGNLPNDLLLMNMRDYNSLLFTSDKSEGWGAVVNEAMSNGCMVIASNQIGSVPFLVKDEVNGFIYKSGDINSLASKMERVINNIEMCNEMSKNAYATMSREWSPFVAANAFLELVNNIINDNLKNYHKQDGPASWATPKF